MNLTTRAEAARALSAHYMPELLATEDLEAFESLVASDGKSLLSGAMAACLAGFDESLRGSMPPGGKACLDCKSREMCRFARTGRCPPSRTGRLAPHCKAKRNVFALTFST